MTSKASTPPPRTDLKDLAWAELEAFLADLGAERYRARQVARWVFKVGVIDVSEMTDLPKSLRQALEQQAQISRLAGLGVSQAGDGTRKQKSTRLNSSHLVISYAVFCLKKKKTMNGLLAIDP